jgi:hypothetical protein
MFSICQKKKKAALGKEKNERRIKDGICVASKGKTKSAKDQKTLLEEFGLRDCLRSIGLVFALT